MQKTDFFQNILYGMTFARLPHLMLPWIILPCQQISVLWIIWILFDNHDHYNDDVDDDVAHDDDDDDDDDDVADDDDEDDDQETRRACIGLPWRGNTMAACASPLSGFSSWNLVLDSGL